MHLDLALIVVLVVDLGFGYSPMGLLPSCELMQSDIQVRCRHVKAADGVELAYDAQVHSIVHPEGVGRNAPVHFQLSDVFLLLLVALVELICT